MLEETLEKGLEFFENVPSPDNPPEPPTELLPDGTVRTGGTGRPLAPCSRRSMRRVPR